MTQADDRSRLGQAEEQGAVRRVLVEDVLVVRGGVEGEAEHGPQQERERVVDQAKGSGGGDDPGGLGQRGRLGRRFGAVRVASREAAGRDRVREPGGQHHEDEGTGSQDEERRLPAEGVGQGPHHERAQGEAEHEGRPLGQDHPWSQADRVVVAQEGVLGRGQRAAAEHHPDGAGVEQDLVGEHAGQPQDGGGGGEESARPDQDPGPRGLVGHQGQDEVGAEARLHLLDGHQGQDGEPLMVGVLHLGQQEDEGQGAHGQDGAQAHDGDQWARRIGPGEARGPPCGQWGVGEVSHGRPYRGRG